ncbi:MAG: TlpA disulfide reductase family protein [Acidobacteriota bacterium]
MMKGLRRYEVALLAVLFVSIALNLLLSREVASLRQTLAVLKSEGRLAVGDPLPPLQAFDLAGKAVTVSYSDGAQPTLLYVFSPSCGWCTRNLPNIRHLTSALRSEYRILGISLSSQELESYIQEKGLGFPVLTQASPASLEAYKLGATPQTLVISPEGTLLKNWLGAYVDQVNEDIQQYFNTQLPGLEEPKNKAAGGM